LSGTFASSSDHPIQVRQAGLGERGVLQPQLAQSGQTVKMPQTVAACRRTTEGEAVQLF
jgi:hypothetical protein